MNKFIMGLIVLITLSASAQEQCGFDQVYNEQGYVVKPFWIYSTN